MKEIARFTPLMMIGLFSVCVLSAQGLRESDSVPLKNWDTPMYWQPSAAESKDAAAKQLLAGNSSVDRASSITAQAQTPANSLVFVGMTPCRVVDTRTGSGFTGFFGPPSLLGGGSRTFPIQSSPQCSIPSIAQAYSFNITVVPPGFLDFITVWPTGQPRPNASTLNGYVNTVIANAAVVPAGTSGSVDVYASQNTNLIIDINGYFAAQSGITLAQGTAGTPSLSFSGDSGTGIFSSGAGNLNIATGGTTRLSMASNGNLSLTGDLNVSGNGVVDGTLSGHFIDAADSYRIGGNTILANWGMGNVFAGVGSGFVSSGNQNAFFGFQSGVFNTSGFDNSFFGAQAGNANSTGFNNTVIGHGADLASGGLVHATAIGSGVIVSASNRVQIGRVAIDTVAIGAFATPTSSIPVCINPSGVFTNCTSSSLRYKESVRPLRQGLNLIQVLHPVTFNWKEDHVPDLGLIAEEVAEVEPLLSTHNDKGEIEGVKYDRLNLVLINAVQEQQAQIEDQQKRITEQQEQLAQQQREIDGLKQLVCLDHPEAAVCK